MKLLSKHQEEVLGSRITVSIIHAKAQQIDAQKAIQECFSECHRIESAFSRFLPDSELSRLNARRNIWTSVSDELFWLLRFCSEMQQMTHGAYDSTVCSILEGWGYDQNYSLLEKENGRTGIIEFDAHNRVRISAPVDLGGVGKGYALDRMLLILQEFPNVFLDAGGDLYGRGKNENGENWRVVFEHPTDTSLVIGETEVDDFFLASSSPSRRFWRNRHHLVDPQKHLPASQMQIVYTQAKKGLLADALSTAFFVSGFSVAKQLSRSVPAETLLLGKDQEIFCTSGFCGMLYR